MLKSLETLDISGCSSLNTWPNEPRKLESLKVFRADKVALNRLFTTTQEVKPAQASICSWLFKPSKPNEIQRLSLPEYLVSLSLADCNLSEVDFPQYFNKMSMLRNLNLSKNPIQGLPDCIRGLTGLKVLRLNSCTKLQSLVGLPKVEILLVGHCKSLEKISYLSALCKPKHIEHTACAKLLDVEGLIKVEPFSKMADYWSFIDLATIEEMLVNIFNPSTQSVMKLPVQVSSAPISFSLCDFLAVNSRKQAIFFTVLQLIFLRYSMNFTFLAHLFLEKRFLVSSTLGVQNLQT